MPAVRKEAGGVQQARGGASEAPCGSAAKPSKKSIEKKMGLKVMRKLIDVEKLL
jgi:hypothetical protein